MSRHVEDAPEATRTPHEASPDVLLLLRELKLLHQRLEQSPLALAAFAIPQNGQNGPALPHELLSSAIRARMLSCDSLGLLSEDRYALILPGAGLFKAQAMVEEILKEAPGLARAVGIAASTGRARAETLLEQAVQALQDALQAGEPVRAYRAAGHPLAERRTLVRSDEKRFLFSGGN